MIWIAAYLYVAGIGLTLLFAWDRNIETWSLRFAVFAPLWPIIFPVIMLYAVVAGTFDYLRDAARKAGA